METQKFEFFFQKSSKFEFWLSTMSWNHHSFVNISLTLVIDTSMGRSSRVLQHENPEIWFFFQKSSKFEFWLSTKTWNHHSFVNISPTLVIDTSMERPSRVLHHGNPKIWILFQKNSKFEFWLSTKSWNHHSFVNISPTLVIDTSVERSSRVLQHENPKIWFFFQKSSKFEFWLSTKSWNHHSFVNISPTLVIDTSMVRPSQVLHHGDPKIWFFSQKSSKFEFWLSTKSWNHHSFINISPTWVIDTSMERSSRVLHHRNPQNWFFPKKKFEIRILTFDKELKSPQPRQYQSYISNWYINGMVFTSTTPWKSKNLIFFQKKSKFKFWHSTNSWNHHSFVKIRPTLVIDTSMEWSSRVLLHGNPKMWFFFFQKVGNRRNWILSVPRVSVRREKKSLWLCQYQSYISNWYVNGKVFTSTTTWEPEIRFFSRKFEI